MFSNAWAVGFQKVKFKNLCSTKIIEHCGTLLKSVSAVGFFEKPWESFSFHREMFCPTHLYCKCDDFHEKNIDKLVQDHFLQSVKDHQYDIFGSVVKIMPCVFFQI